MEPIFTTMTPSPIGWLRLCASESGLTQVFQANQQQALKISEWQNQPGHVHLAAATRELAEYFDGKRRDFSVPIAPTGTDFQQAVWRALRDIPYGQTVSYREIAERIGNPKAVRAVGAANGRNPLSIFVPCHRVIGKDGTLTGYAGGLEAKHTLLALERGELPLFASSQ